MADDHECALEATEPFFQPVDRAEIQVIGRLVEQQHVGILRKRADDRRPPTLAAAGGRGVASKIDPDLVGDGRCLVGLRRALPGQHPILQRREAGHRRVLFQQDDAGARNGLANSLVGVDLAREALEQRRLAGPVTADQRQPVARADMNVDAAKEPAFPLDEAEIFEAEHGRRHGGALAAREVPTQAGACTRLTVPFISHSMACP